MPGLKSSYPVHLQPSAQFQIPFALLSSYETLVFLPRASQTYPVTSPPLPKKQHHQLSDKLQAWKLNIHDRCRDSTQQSCSDKHHPSHHTAIIISSFYFAWHRKDAKSEEVGSKNMHCWRQVGSKAKSHG